jgi:hypothetical protein
MEVNSYAYAGGEPINNVDPQGTAFFDVIADGFDKLGKALDVLEVLKAAKGAFTSDEQAVKEVAAGAAAGFFVATTCGFGAVGITSITGGTAGAPSAAFCSVATMAASEAASRAV